MVVEVVERWGFLAITKYLPTYSLGCFVVGIKVVVVLGQHIKLKGYLVPFHPFLL